MAFNLKNAWSALWASKPVETRANGASPYSPFVEFALHGEGADSDNKTFDRVARKAFEENVIGFKCVSLIANGVGSLDWYLRNTRSGKEVETHPLLDLINNPNPLQSKAVFFAHAQGSKLLDGNMFIEKVGPNSGPPRELWNLRPDYIQVIMGQARIPTAYIYTPGGPGGGNQKTYPVDPITGASQVMHTMSYSPLYETSMGRGLSPLRAAWLALLTHSDGQRWNHSLLKNGARPTGAFVSTAGSKGVADLTPEQIAFLKAQVQEMYSGSMNSGRPMMLSGLDWKPMSLNPTDMDFLNLKNSSARDIANVLGVPSMLLGIPGDNTYSNYREARASFYEDTVLPHAYALADELNRWLVPEFGPNLELCIDEDRIAALEPKREAKWARATSADFITINEKREMVGYEPIDQGDELLVPTNVTPLATTLEPADLEEPSDEE